MSKLDSRLDQLVQGMSPEDKARYLIESPFRGHAVSDLERRQLFDKMKPEEGRRYNAFAERWKRLRHNMVILLNMASEIKTRLLMRDRMLWYWRGVIDVEEQVIFKHGQVLLEKNANIKAGKPLEITTFMGRVRLGVSGKNRSPFGRKLGVEMSPKMEAVLTLLSLAVRKHAGECKALARYLEEEGDAMGLTTVKALVAWGIRELQEYDRPLLREIGPGHSGRVLPDGAILPVEERWALVWEDVEEDSETAGRVRADPEDWQPMSVDRMLAGGSWEELFSDVMREYG